MEQTAVRWTFWRVANTLLCLGLNLLIERFKLDPRWQWALWGVIALNEARGLYILYEVGRTAVTQAFYIYN